MHYQKQKKNIGTLYIKYGSITIKQYWKDKYFGCELDKNLTGESLALNVINNINATVRFIVRKNRFLSPYLKRLLSNAIIQRHFDAAYAGCYPNLNKKIKSKLQKIQLVYSILFPTRYQKLHWNKRIWEKTNWFPVCESFNEYLCLCF